MSSTGLAWNLGWPTILKEQAYTGVDLLSGLAQIVTNDCTVCIDCEFMKLQDFSVWGALKHQNAYERLRF